ncbi:protease modulator HflC [Rhodobium gokarnense]|uniref:Protein HflC n=1 Tax=Rhodobium gokarnense TaxID=364296 RepID=A0ABT3H9D6_9HYPH|nr:protease modulator HflC [Rhodobium gokarnense]MCW2306998.1 membrane protease subunit HflC [Rhodobium gokarnense]
MKKLPIILGGIAVLALLVYSSIFVVNAREQAIVVRLGQIRTVITEPGIYFKVPTNFFEQVQIIENRLLRMDLENINVQVSDGKRYVVDAFLVFKIIDPRRFRESVSGSLALVEQRLITRLNAALRRVYGLRSFEDALSAQRAEMMRDVRDQIRPDASSLGIDIVDVRIRRTDLLPEVSQQTFERMKAERLARAAQIRANGRQEAQRIRAEADRKAVVLVAEANRISEILRGEGEGDRNRIFAEAFQRDPEFFAFYRSMKAYETAIEESGTTMVLSPDSEFFRFFRDPGETGGYRVDPSASDSGAEAPADAAATGDAAETPATPASAPADASEDTGAAQPAQ